MRRGNLCVLAGILVALVAPAAMIFVPSIDGRSHAPEEYTEPADLVRGVQALVEVLMEVDKHV